MNRTGAARSAHPAEVVNAVILPMTDTLWGTAALWLALLSRTLC